MTFSYVGFDTKKLHVEDTELFKLVSLAEQSNALDEVVVIGYGTQKKESMVASITSVKPSDLNITSSSLTTAFAGNIAGMISRQTSGEPGYDSASFYIRGISTFGSSNSPLIILDGVEVLSNMLNNMPPESIESFSVLKDAQATSVYGSRGANGAILITTKTGDDIGEKTEITLNSSTMFTAGYLTLPEQQSIYGTGDFGQYSYLDGKGGGVYDGLWTWGPKLDQKDPTTPSGYFETVQYNSPIDPKTGKRIPTPFVSHKDNFRNFLQQGLTTSNNVSISHKFKEGSFRISLNQLYRRGQTPNTDLKRFGVNMAANYNITRKLHINASMIYNYTYSKNRPWSGYGNSHPYYNILVYMGANNDIRDLRNYWEEGQEGYAQRNWNHVWFNNPWFVAEEYTRPYSEPELIASASLDYDITDDLNFMVKAATDSKHQNQEECKPYAWVGNDRGLYSVGSDRRVDVNLDAMLSYKKRFGEFDLDAMLGVSLFNYQRNYQPACII